MDEINRYNKILNTVGMYQKKKIIGVYNGDNGLTSGDSLKSTRLRKEGRFAKPEAQHSQDGPDIRDNNENVGQTGFYIGYI